MDFKKLQNELILNRIGSSKINLVNSKPIFKQIFNEPLIIMACNIRIKHVVPGIMKAAEELNSIMCFELAKSEGHIDGGYTGQTPEIFADMLLDYADKYKFTMPFFIHGDHITVKDTSNKAIDSAKQLIEAELKAGYTSYAIDASFNQIPDNIKITTELAKPILDADFGLEVEVGEVIPRRTYPHHIPYPTLIPNQPHFHQQSIQQSPTPSHEGFPFNLFLVTWSLSTYENFSIIRSHKWDGCS